MRRFRCACPHAHAAEMIWKERTLGGQVRRNDECQQWSRNKVKSPHP